MYETKLLKRSGLPNVSPEPESRMALLLRIGTWLSCFQTAVLLPTRDLGRGAHPSSEAFNGWHC